MKTPDEGIVTRSTSGKGKKKNVVGVTSPSNSKKRSSPPDDSFSTPPTKKKGHGTTTSVSPAGTESTSISTPASSVGSPHVTNLFGHSSVAEVAAAPHKPGSRGSIVKDFKSVLDDLQHLDPFARCAISVTERLPISALNDVTNPARVFLAIDSNRYTVNSCFDYVRGIACEWAMEKLKLGDDDWRKVVISICENDSCAHIVARDAGATHFVACKNTDDIIQITSLGKPASGPQAVEASSLSSFKSGVPINGDSGVFIKQEKGVEEPPSSDIVASKSLGLDEMDFKISKESIKSIAKARESVSSARSDLLSYRLAFHLTPIINVSGRAKVAGVIGLFDKRNEPFWVYKPEIVSDTFQVLVQTHPGLSHMTDFISGLSTAHQRDIPCGANLGKMVVNKKGQAYPVHVNMFTLDLSEKIRDQHEELKSLVQNFHEAFTSRFYKEAYIEMMLVNRRFENLGRLVDKPTNHAWTTFRDCQLEVNESTPLNTFLLDDDIKSIMGNLTGGKPTNEWTSELRSVAFKNGIIPGGF